MESGTDTCRQTPPARWPVSIYIIAGFFLLWGIVCVCLDLIKMIHAWPQVGPSKEARMAFEALWDLAVCWFFGFGILRGILVVRNLILFYCWICFVVFPIGIFMLLIAPSRARLQLHIGPPEHLDEMFDSHPYVSAMMLVAVYLILIWIYRALTRPEVRKLFVRQEP
jgi:hypothetical protein